MVKKGKLKQNKAITLVALVITIIILLILATITIQGLKNTNLFSKTIDAKNKYKKAETNEANILDDYANEINSITGGNSKPDKPDGGNGKTNGGTCVTPTKIEKADGSKKIEICGNMVTVTENGTTYTATVDTNKDPSSIEKDSNGNWKNDYDENTKNVLSKVYGTEVEYTGSTDINSKTWRIFYIDFANKYKDGAGTIYLKADWTENDTKLDGQASYTPTDADKTILKNMNQKWYTARGIATWNENEHEAAWLCSPSKWTKYKNSSAKYAIGSPSTEMYCDSYNSVNHSTGNYKITCQYQTNIAPGYGYLVNGIAQNSGHYTNYNTLDTTGYSTMYCKSGSYFWWLASPSAYCSPYVCRVKGSDANLSATGDGWDKHSVCPLVSLPSNIQLSIK